MPGLREADGRVEGLKHSPLRTRQDARRHECLSASLCPGLRLEKCLLNTKRTAVQAIENEWDFGR
jgi:hypothetical protein